MNENVVSDIISKLQCSDKIGLDIGANHGAYTGLIAEKCKYCYAFEPSHANFVILLASVKNENVIFVHEAVGNTTGLTKLYLCQSNPGGHSISPKIGESPHFGHSLDRTQIIHATTLDDYFGDSKEIGFMKIDVEGAEEFVLQGARKLLDNNKIIIALETHQTIDRESIYKYMSEKGYVFIDENKRQASKIEHDQHYIVHNLGDDFKV